KKVNGIEFEYSPGRGSEKYTGDRSAFDVFITYDGTKGKGFIGIEVKYAEDLRNKPATAKPQYTRVATDSSAFSVAAIEELAKMPRSVEQLWRDHLLCLAMLQDKALGYKEGKF